MTLGMPALENLRLLEVVRYFFFFFNYFYEQTRGDIKSPGLKQPTGPPREHAL